MGLGARTSELNWVDIAGLVFLGLAAVLVLLSLVMTVYNWITAPARIRWQRASDDRARLRKRIEAMGKKQSQSSIADREKGHAIRFGRVIEDALNTLEGLRAEAVEDHKRFAREGTLDVETSELRRRYLSFRGRNIRTLRAFKKEVVDAAFVNVNRSEWSLVEVDMQTGFFIELLDEHKAALEDLQISAYPPQDGN